MTNEEILNNFELEALKCKKKSSSRYMKIGLIFSISFFFFLIFSSKLTIFSYVICLIVVYCLVDFILNTIYEYFNTVTKKYKKKNGSRTRIVLSYNNVVNYNIDEILGTLGYTKKNTGNENIYYAFKSVRMKEAHRYLTYKTNGNKIEFELWCIKKNKELSMASNPYYGWDAWLALSYDLRVIDNKLKQNGENPY